VSACFSSQPHGARSVDAIVIPAKAREYVFTGVGLCVSVCLYVTTNGTITKKIADGFAPNFMRTFLGESAYQVRVSLRPVE